MEPYNANPYADYEYLDRHEPFHHGRRLRRRSAPLSKRDQITAAEVAHAPAQREIFAQYNYAHTNQHAAEQWPLYSSGDVRLWNDGFGIDAETARNFDSHGTRVRNFRGIAPKGYSRSDTRIMEDICEHFANDPDVDATDIAVDVQAGIVMLTGTVTERRQKYRAELIADAIRGVRDIDNRITLQRTRTFD